MQITELEHHIEQTLARNPFLVLMLEQDGYVRDEAAYVKKFPTGEINVELCIGDFCVSAWDSNMSMFEPKTRCLSQAHAVAMATILEARYFKSP